MYRIIAVLVCALFTVACGEMEVDDIVVEAIEGQQDPADDQEGDDQEGDDQEDDDQDDPAPTCHAPLPCGVGQPGQDDPRERFCPDPTGRGQVAGRVYAPGLPEPILWFHHFDGGVEYMRCDGTTGEAYLHTHEPDDGQHCVWYCSLDDGANDYCPDLPDC